MASLKASEEYEDTAECTVSDEYIEHLKKKYLVKLNSHGSDDVVLSQKTTTSSDIESYSDLPANPSLTASERRHYNRAMKEIGKALKLSEKQHKALLHQFKNCAESPSCDEVRPAGPKVGHTTDHSEDVVLDRDVLSLKADHNDGTEWQSILPNSTMLPSTIPAEDDGISKGKSSITVSTSLEDAALFWDEESSTLNGLSHRFFPSFNDAKPISLSDIKAIYSELAGIYEKIQLEKKNILKQNLIEQKIGTNISSREDELAIREAFLLEKEKELLERERAMSVAIQKMQSSKEIQAKLQGVEFEVQEKFESLQQRYRLQMEKMNDQILAQAQETKRLQSSFQTVKNQNEELRTKLVMTSNECSKLKSQNIKLKKRLENLQRKQEFHSSKTDKALRISNKENSNEKLPVSSKPVEKTAKVVSTTMDALTVLFDWTVESVFRTKDLFPKAELDTKAFGLTNEFITDKCLKILPLFVDILKASSQQPSLKKNQFSYLSFIYHCLRRVDDSQHSILSSTTRRLGDELYRPVTTSVCTKDSTSALILATTAAYSVVDSLDEATHSLQHSVSKPCQNLYFRSTIPQVRMMSCFIIIKTLHQVDILAHVFGQLQKDLKDDVNRKMFLDFNAIHIIMPYITYKANKALLNDAIDVLMQMAMESVFLPLFLEQCSKEEWFRAFSSSIRDMASSIEKPSFKPDVLEKICVILQKLSKIKSNKKYFDAFSIGRSLQECYRCRNPENTFLSLNLRSILFNLDLLKES